jgi:hypothetical protein
MKSLAICSNDFYSNIPDWLSTFETPSFVSAMPVMPTFNSLIATLINTRNTMDSEFNVSSVSDMNADADVAANAVLPNPSNNFLLYYYVEYM